MDSEQSPRKARLDKALALFQQAYEHQMSGELGEAASLYQASIALFPTAEAHTFLGWTYSFQGNLDAAIVECQKAIEIDPEFGNPYNDIGAYLIEQQKYDEAIPWLERALHAGRYESYHFPWFNLGRAHAGKECYSRALECFREALALDPDYAPAADAARSARLKIH
ncbi:MAG: tetratricopeptide repeat protein [Acidobacteria bacterium]|nr:tetratricopeptide repeat protein [Acidobacteriota bacterium]